jgi:hypothetical protein
MSDRARLALGLLGRAAAVVVLVGWLAALLCALAVMIGAPA